QDEGRDTVDANLDLGLPVDARDYGVGSQILYDLGVRTMRLMTNNPTKRAGITGYGLEIVERIPLVTKANPHNVRYLDTKATRLGHLLADDEHETACRRSARPSRAPTPPGSTAGWGRPHATSRSPTPSWMAPSAAPSTPESAGSR